MVLAVGLIAGGRIGFVFFPTPEGQVIYANATFVAGTPRAHTEAFLATRARAVRRRGGARRRPGTDRGGAPGRHDQQRQRRQRAR
jgi:hypothetical protein